jgi:hypothetical protein
MEVALASSMPPVGSNIDTMEYLQHIDQALSLSDKPGSLLSLASPGINQQYFEGVGNIYVPYMSVV